MTQPQDGWDRLNANVESGTTYARKTDDRREALRSIESGPTAPVSPVVGMFWLDTSNQSFPHLRQYSGTAWVTYFVLDVANNRIRLMLDSDRDSYAAPTGTDGQLGIWIEGNLSFIFHAAGLTMGNTATSLALDMSDKTTAMAVPRGTTAQRPSPTGLNGALYYNETLNELQQVVSNAWVKIPVPSDIVGFKRQTVTIGGASPAVTWAEFTNIPESTRIMRLFIQDVDVSGGQLRQDTISMQLGDVGGYETAGYINNNVYPSSVDAFNLVQGGSQVTTATTSFSLINMSGDKWLLEPGGIKTLSGTLTSFRVGMRRIYNNTPDAPGGIPFLTTGSGVISVLYT